MLNYLEQELQLRGTRIWFGHVTSDLNADRLRTFYTSDGFKVARTQLGDAGDDARRVLVL